MDIAIRPYVDADFDAVTAIWLESWESTGIALSPPVTLSDLRKRFPRELAEGWTVHVATLGSKIVGFIATHGSTLEQLFIAPNHQNHGIGKQLLDFAKARMTTGFVLITALQSRAPRFYEREGLIRGEVGAHPQYGHAVIRYEWRP